MDKTLSPPPLELGADALFLDYDGTLVELAPTPGEAVADEGLLRLLIALHAEAGGALAVVTGRPAADIDAFLAPLRLPLAALHGLAVRPADGAAQEAPGQVAGLAAARGAFDEFAAAHPGTRVEDKGLSVALHFRGAAGAADAADRLAQALAEASGGALRLQRGKMVVELLPAGTDKGTGIAGLMDTVPFAGRRPVFVGDDVTDEAGFAAVNRLGGMSIKVGDGSTAAARRLPDVAAVRAWLGQGSVS
ncbi:MAG: trehalose-phosphatase [Geminicoccaceae bacterium]